MSDENANSNADGNAASQPQINVLGQYIKDLSFENPSAPESFRSSSNNPQIQINFNVAAQSIADGAYEVSLTMEAEAKSDSETLFRLELVYAGGFQLKNLPQEAIQPILFIECPALLFPFVRRIVADLTREGGYPPILLDPIDFAALFRQRLAQEQKAEGSEGVTTQ
ncbi:MAG: protein-export chaperone SecB [Alphaproteobacteria bacterium]